MRSVTVIMPVLNGMPYLRFALESLARQRSAAFEVILWCNGSNDGTLEEARAWIPHRIPGRIVERPLPLHECLARMVIESTTPYCARLDADDIAHPDRIGRQLDFLNDHRDVAVVGSQYELMDEAGKTLPAPERFPESNPDILASLIWRNVLMHPTLMFRRDAVLEAGNYQIPAPCEDFDLWLRIAGRHRMVNLSERLTRYRVHERSIIARARSIGALEEPNMACIAAHAPRLVALTAEEYRKLRAREFKVALRPMLRVARRLGELANSPTRRIVFSPWFLLSARVFTSKVDIISRLAWRVIEATGREQRLGFWATAES
jgi:glycosyltransferase involved in cell wall biosynthesis